MNNTWKIYMLTLISFLVGTSQFVISGILDEVATSVGVSLSTAGQLITIFALAVVSGVFVVTSYAQLRIWYLLDYRLKSLLCSG